MEEKKRLLIVGFGNIGQAVLSALQEYPDFKCIGIVSRDPARTRKQLQTMNIFRRIPIYSLEQKKWKECGADIAALCGGSKKDLPIHGPLFAKYFNTVCSFDTHGHVDDYIDPESGKRKRGYYHIMSKVASRKGHVAMVCQGWDPGIFSMMRALFTSCMGGTVATGFYGLKKGGGLSMGHSDAIRTIEGVQDARSYTHAKKETIKLMLSGEKTTLSPGDMHWRECFVVAKKGANLKKIREKIINMPDYFKPYHTKVTFVSQEELDAEHKAMPHDGIVICTAKHGMMEYRNVWMSNPRGTAGILLAFARAAVRMSNLKMSGAFTALDIPIRFLLPNKKKKLSFI